MNRFHFAYGFLFLFSTFLHVLSQDVIGCGGFIKSNTEINYKIIKVKLLTKDGAVKYTSEASPVNGYYMIPVYNKGEYILQVTPPPGWSFEPNQVSLNVDGVNDPCSKNEDINFMFKGFGLSGKVVTHGDSKLNGPSGIKLNLILDKQVIDKTESGPDGSYYFSNVMPGSYLVEAQHPTIKFITDKVNVVLSKENWSAKDNIVISGFKIEGLVTTLDKSPVKDALVELYFAEKSYSSISTSSFECDLSSKSDLKICHTKTDQNGMFRFGNAAFGKYQIRTSLSKNNLDFSMTPDSQLADLTRHQNILVEKPFILDSVTLKSQILLSENNKPLASGEVYINDKKSTIDIKDGFFTFSKLTSGSYKISIKSKNVYYDEKLVNVDLSSSGSLQAESSPHQRILSITKFVAKSFDVCGRVKILKESQSGSGSISNADLVKAVKIKCTSDSNPKQIQSATLDQNLNYCLQLETNGVYTIKTELSDSLLQILKLIPDEKKVSVVDGPLFNIDFEQLEAKLEGEIRFLPKQVTPENFLVTLKANDVKRVWQEEVKLECKVETKTNSTSVNVCKFKLTNLLFGKYFLTTNYDDLFCWKKQDASQETIINVNSETQKALIEQEGYKLNYELSHKNVQFKITEPTTKSVILSKNILNESDLKGSICLPQAVNYNLLIESCHKFTQETTDFDLITIESSLFTKNKNTIKLVSLKTQVVVDVVFKFEDVNDEKRVNENDMFVEIHSEQTPQIELIKFRPKKIVKENIGEVVFTSKSWIKPNQLIKMVVKSSKLLFESTSKELRVDEQNCEINHVKFEAKLGIFLVGSVKPKDIDSIDLIVKSSVDDSVVHASTINGLNGFRVGPLKSPASLYKVELAKTNFLFSKGSILNNNNNNKDEYNLEFTAQKLGQLKVTVINTHLKTNLEHALLSLSSEDRTYRQSLKSDQNGFASFDNLKPGLYYLIVMMQEYEFVPNSHPIQITDGFHMNLQVEAKRIAYSCFGKVTSINGQAESDIEVTATGRKALNDATDEQNEICKTSIESARVEPSGFGSYRIYNLKPKCEYVLSVRNLDDSFQIKNSKILPQAYALRIDDSDIIDQNFILLDQVDRLDLSIAVSYRPREQNHLPLNYKQINNFVRIKLFKTNQPDTILQTQLVPANSVAYFNSLPRTKQIEQYSIQVELLAPSSTISPFGTLSQQQQASLHQQPIILKTELSFYSDSSHKHLSVSFDLDTKNGNSFFDMRHQQYQTFYWTVPIFLIAIVLVFNWRMVLTKLGNLKGQIQQRGGLLNFLMTIFSPKNSSTTSTTSSGPATKTPNKSAYMQQKTQSRGGESFADTKSSPKQKIPVAPPSPPSSFSSLSSSSSSTSSSQNQDNINLDEYETVNIDPNDDPEYISSIANVNTAVKRKPRKI